MSQPRSQWKRQRQQQRTARREAKRAAKRNMHKPRTVPKSQRVQRAVSHQSQRGMPRLVRQAVGRMIERARVLTMPRVDAQEAA